MKRALPILALLLVSFSPAMAQSGDPVAADRIVKKMRQLDLMNQLLPVLLRPEQVRALLPAVEKARDAMRKLEAAEAEDLKAIEEEVDAGIAAAKDKGQVPPRELLQKMFKLIVDFQLRRQVAISEHLEATMKKVEEVFDAGQIKSAANSLDPKVSAPGADVTKLTDRDKLRTWVLLDPLMYEILVDMSKPKNGGGQ
jgi:hypothetical protein